MLAALDDVPSLKALVATGVDVVHANRIGINPASGFGEQPIHTAASLGSLNALSYLIEEGADPNAPGPKGARPLHYAAKTNSRDLVDALLDYGANPRLKDAERHATASDWARFFGNFELAGYLEERE
jgi:ankyrin repeat protein